ncbi:unnamed protein product, partial [Iphiclides podalirius]
MDFTELYFMTLQSFLCKLHARCCDVRNGHAHGTHTCAPRSAVAARPVAARPRQIASAALCRPGSKRPPPPPRIRFPGRTHRVHLANRPESLPSG